MRHHGEGRFRRSSGGSTWAGPTAARRTRHARGRRSGARWSVPRRSDISGLVLAGLVLPMVLATAVASTALVAVADPLPAPDTSEFGATGELPGAVPEAPAGGGAGPSPGEGTGIPEVALAAYRSAEDLVAADAPDCRLPWSLVAGIGKVESDHASNGAVDPDGVATPSILGPVLSGGDGMATIADTDGGALDGDATWDRAVGPTQFLPATWGRYGADGDRDGRKNPQDLADAAAGTGRYLCAGSGDVTDPARRHDAVFRYNHSEAYVADVLAWADAYAAGASAVPGDLALADGPAGDLAAPGAALPGDTAPVAAAQAGALPPAAGVPGAAPPIGEGGGVAAGGPGATAMGADTPAGAATVPGPSATTTPGPASPTKPGGTTPTPPTTTAGTATPAQTCRRTFTPEYVRRLLVAPAGAIPELAPVTVKGNRTTCTLATGGTVYLVLEVVERPTDTDRAEARAFAPTGELVETPARQRYVAAGPDRITSVEVSGGARATERALQELTVRYAK